MNHALAEVLVGYFIINFLKIKLSAAQSWEQISSEELQKLARIIWSFAFECRLN